MAEPITPERLKAVVAAWHRSLSERLEMGENALIAWGAVPDLADEVERRTAEAEELRAEVDRLKAQVQLMGSHLQRESLAAIDKAQAAREAAE